MWAHYPLAARVIASCPGQGWSLLCNGIIASDGRVIDRPEPPTRPQRTGRKVNDGGGREEAQHHKGRK
jgi:Family of unknown function (DUF5999)